MRPDSYHTRSPDNWDMYSEEGSSLAVSKVTVGERTLPLILSAFAIGAVAILIAFLPQIIDSKVKAGMAEARAGMEQQVADTRAVAQTAKEHARVALDKVEQTQVQLGAKGLVQPSTH